MKKNLPFVILFALAIPLLAGCYTQVGSTKDDMYSDEYVKETEVPIAEEEVVTEDSSAPETDYYFDQNGYPRDRFYFDSYYPASMYIGALWYSPFYGSWGWYGGYYGYPYPYPYSYAGWGFSGYCYYPGYYSHNSSYVYGGGGHGSTRTVGSTRGSVGGTRSRGEDTHGGSGTGTALDLPTGLRSGGGSTGAVRGSNVKPQTSTARTGRTAVDNNGSRSGTSTTGTKRSGSARGSGNVRQPRRAGSATGNTGSTGPRVNTAKPAERSAPAATPPANQGGTRGGNNTGSSSGTTRGGGRR